MLWLIWCLLATVCSCHFLNNLFVWLFFAYFWWNFLLRILPFFSCLISENFHKTTRSLWKFLVKFVKFCRFNTCLIMFKYQWKFKSSNYCWNYYKYFFKMKRCRCKHLLLMSLIFSSQNYKLVLKQRQFNCGVVAVARKYEILYSA